MVRHVPYSGTRIVVYEALRSRLGAEDSSLGTKMALGASAGALGQAVAVPADVTKARRGAARRAQQRPCRGSLAD
jgi:solute carrier family 25 uncoupling protein 27